MEKKQLHVEMKDESEGVVLAKFATLGVKDLDGDIIEPGAIGNQQVKISSFGHGSWAGGLPVGKGETRENSDEALADLEFFMNTAHGKDHFETIKGLGELGEWSFGFDVLEEGAPDEEQRQAGVNRVLKKLHIFEVSPVLRGAGVGTGTVMAKCDDCAAKEKEDEEQPTPDESPELRAEIEEEVAKAKEILERAGG